MLLPAAKGAPPIGKDAAVRRAERGVEVTERGGGDPGRGGEAEGVGANAFEIRAQALRLQVWPQVRHAESGPAQQEGEHEAPNVMLLAGGAPHQDMLRAGGGGRTTEQI